MKTYNFTLTEDYLNIIASALNELPAKHANPVLQELTRQLQSQPETASTEVTGIPD